MSKKIVITGGLGYVGTELCKIYSGVSWNNEILVIDNRFVSERVNQLRNWGIEFIHGDILDKDLVNKYCKDADIVHHLAGITDVPRVKSESGELKDKKIKLVGEEGTQNILEAISNKCKIIFPSTHVVYEGIEKVKNDIKRFNQLGYQTAIHCIGDKANRIALDLYEDVGIKECRNRIEHAQMVANEDIPKFLEIEFIIIEFSFFTSKFPNEIKLVEM